MFNSMNKHLFYRAQRYNITSNNTKKSYSILKKNRNHKVAIPVMCHRLASRQVKLLSC